MKEMKSLRQICNEACILLTTFNKPQSSAKYSSIDELEKLVKEWIVEEYNHNGETSIGGYRISEKNGNLLIVVEEFAYGEEPGSDFTRYSIYRFFNVAGKWQVSVDLEGATAKTMIQHLLDKQ